VDRIVDATKYVVLDVETNGLSSLKDDLLSITFFKPDDSKIYNRFLPLEFDSLVWTTRYNGITKKDLDNKEPLTQDEFDELIRDFELEKRIILTYGSLDEKFIRNYLKRKRIEGFEKLSFYNFKHDIISSGFSGGIVTKDNLCKMFEIGNVQEVHSGLNDCLLEWQLFEAIYGKKLIVFGDRVYEFSEDYIIPAKYLHTYPNIRYCVNDLPKIKYKNFIVKKFEIIIEEKNANYCGISADQLESLIEQEISQEDRSFEYTKCLKENNRRISFIGILPHNMYYGADNTDDYDNSDFQTSFNDLTTEKKNEIINNKSIIENQDYSYLETQNISKEKIKSKISPVTQFIKQEIFNNNDVISGETVFNKEGNVVAVCNLSSDNAVLFFKTDFKDVNYDKYPLYYQSMGRDIFLLSISKENNNGIIEFVFYKVTEAQLKDAASDLAERKHNFEKSLNNKNISVIDYINCQQPITLLCKKCGNTWTASYSTIKKNSSCRFCDAKKV